MSKTDVSRSARLAGQLANEFYDAGFDLSSRDMDQGGAWSRMPEVECAEQLRDSGALDRDIRMYLTFIAAMDRARDANRLWRDGLALFRAMPGLFEPAMASVVPIDSLRRTLRDARVSQRHGPDSEAWSRIASTLASGEGPVRRVIEDGVGDAQVLLKDLRSKRAGQSSYPMLRGPKVGPMWVRIIAAPGGAAIRNIDSIPVAVDVHVKRVTENLGVADTADLNVYEAKPIIHAAWHDAVAETSIGGPPGIAGTCAALDPALWLFGKYGCSFCEKKNKLTPISQACDGCRLHVPSE